MSKKTIENYLQKKGIKYVKDFVIPESEPTPNLKICGDNVLWIIFKEHNIRIEQDKKYNDGKLMITVHKGDNDYHAKLLVEKPDEC